MAVSELSEVSERADYTFVLKLTDRPGAMELIAATFSHRGLSLTSTLGNDGTLDPDGSATVLLRFRATPTRKDALKATLTRLSRVLSLREHTDDDPTLRIAALIRLAPEAPPFPVNLPITLQLVASTDSGEKTYSLLGPPVAVTALLETARVAGHLRAVTQTVLAL